MAANIDPIYSRSPDVQWIGPLVTANTTIDLTGGTSYLTFTSDGTNGGFLQKLRFRATPGTSPVTTVARVWINNGATVATATNNVLFDELTLPGVTTSTTIATAGVELAVNVPLPAGFKIYLTLGGAPSPGTWQCTAVGGKY